MRNTKRILSKRLQAIVFTDIVKFTELSSKDEQYAVELIDKQRDILKPIVESYNGEWLKEIGDGLLFSFNSSLDAVKCSIEIQKTLRDVDDLNLRIGIHQGDIFIKDGDIFGDDVNIASRVEGFSPEGGISISDKVCNDISGVKDIKTKFIGHKKLKGVSQETKIRCIVSDDLPKHKTSLLPKIISYLSFFLGFQWFLAVLGILFFKNEIVSQIPPFTANDVLEMLISETIIFFLFGYSCLSFYRGYSLNSQKAILFFSYLYITYILFDVFIVFFKEYNFGQSEPPENLFSFDFLFFIIFIIVFVIIPLLLMYLSKRSFKYFKQKNK